MSELKPENQDIDIVLTTDSTSGTSVTFTVHISEQPISQSGANGIVADKLKLPATSVKVTCHNRVVRAPTRLIEMM